MNYQKALGYIHGTLKFGIKLGLTNINSLLELLGNPHKKLKYVHVAGTNGKGSTVAFISSILMEAGQKTGIYTSPYIERFTERIRIGYQEIPEDEVARLTALVKDKVDIMLSRGENHPTEFEIVTAIAFQYFYENGCDVVVLEVGLGGRYDSTNVIDRPLVSVITTISFDHMDKLGNTLPQIAFEKAGIIKEDGDVVSYPQVDEVMKVFRDVCNEKMARLYETNFDTVELKRFDVNGQEFDYGPYHSLKISLLGCHQVRNTVLAVRTAEILRTKGMLITEEEIRKGLLNAKWPGRLEVLRREPVFLIDGAHNAEGAKALSDFLGEYFPNKRIIFIIGVLKDKDYMSIVKPVITRASKVITVTPESERALPSYELADIMKVYCKNVYASDTIETAVDEALASSHIDDVICAYGSLYYIGSVRKLLNGGI